MGCSYQKISTAILKIMNKKNIILLLFMINSLSIFAKTDGNIQLYFPSFLGNSVSWVGSSSPLYYMGNDNESGFSAEGEARIEITTLNKFAFSWAVGFGGYGLETETGSEGGSLFLSAGSGVFYNFIPEQPSLAGPCIYFYPAYKIPCYWEKGTPYYFWKSSLDIGFNFCISRFSIYLYEKTIFAWHESKIKVIPDFGLAVGIYFKDGLYL